ncbi:ESX-1 secretion-associated protein EspA [Mycobacterium ulcerans str. Harvey]|uniref:ESX-1 secretion-associated protein EspA n=1 Tax=Mycobacterium ulcerans str. Harvey TaxID=1299332 RepID=A0ABP3A4D1_MYCUL|nr:ESX-1 secretion-associated protein EspA [Mycobacterium ulcerans str. Harvey]
MDLTYIPIVGWAMSAAFQAPVCAAAMAVVGGALAYLVVKTLINSMKLVSLLAQLAKLLAEAVADVVSDVVDIIKGILEEVWEFLTHPFEFLKDLLNKLVSWASSLLSQWGSKLQSFFGGIPGLSGMGGGLSQLTSFFSSAGAAGSAGSVGAADSASLVSSAGLPGGLGLGGGSGFGSMPNVAQLRSAATRQDPRLTSEGPTRVSSEPVGEHAQAASAQGARAWAGCIPRRPDRKARPARSTRKAPRRAPKMPNARQLKLGWVPLRGSRSDAPASPT